VIKPLRGVRTWLKQEGCPGRWVETAACLEFRDRIKGAELQGEKLQQTVLESLCRDLPVIVLPAPAQLAAVIKNQQRYFESTGIDYRLIDKEGCTVILAAAVEHADPDLIRQSLGA
jgi:hypothetical protein